MDEVLGEQVKNSEGEIKILTDKITALKKELDKPVESRKLPVFVSKQDDGTKNFIIPVRGKGLWGPIWGYVALKNDYNTIVGASFDHKSETPGLGAEINTTEFEQQFVGKKLFNKDNEFVSVDVVKGGAPDDDPHAVDAISGGTITSNGLDAMLEDNLGSYVTYFKQHQK